jgi:hypothetical protein
LYALGNCFTPADEGGNIHKQKYKEYAHKSHWVKSPPERPSLAVGQYRLYDPGCDSGKKQTYESPVD